MSYRFRSEPKRTRIFDFRMQPTRIAAVRGPHGWGIEEWSVADRKKNIYVKTWELDCRADWKIIFPLGRRLCAVLAGRTIAEAKLGAIPAEDFPAALAVMRANIPWLTAAQVVRDPETRKFMPLASFKAKIRYRRNSRATRLARLPDGRPRHLTIRERQVLTLLCAGAANKDIAAQLAIAPRTVESHRTAIYRKVGASTIAPVVRWAIRERLIEP